MPLSFREFKDALARKVSEQKKGTFEFKTINRSNGISYTGLVQKDCTEGIVISPVVNVNTFYRDYLDGVPLDKCVGHAIAILDTERPKLSVNNITEWENVKDILYPRLVSKNISVDQYPHKDIADLYIIYTIRLNIFDDETLSESVVINELAECWGKSVEELHEQAIKNLETDDFLTADMGVFEIVTNKYKVKGAIECLNPKVLEKYNNHYILPSSTDEVLFVPKSSGFSVSDLKEIVMTVNNSVVSKEQKLSDNVYEYVNGNLTIVEK